MGQSYSDPFEGKFDCVVYKINKVGSEQINDASNYFFRIDDGSWECIVLLMEHHLQNLFPDLHKIGCGFGGDEGDGEVVYTSRDDITHIPSMFFKAGKQKKFVYKLKDGYEVGLKTYRMDFIKNIE